jgi:hypothetical protein
VSWVEVCSPIRAARTADRCVVVVADTTAVSASSSALRSVSSTRICASLVSDRERNVDAMVASGDAPRASATSIRSACSSRTGRVLITVDLLII